MIKNTHVPNRFKTINENIVNTKQKYCEVLKMKGLVDSCVDLSPGLKMKNTEILDGNCARKVLSSNGKCIDECYKKTSCVAVDFCVHCSSKDSKYNVCHMYDEIKTKSGRKDEKWETKILVPEIEKQFVLQDTAVLGIERSLDNNSSVVTLHAALHMSL